MKAGLHVILRGKTHYYNRRIPLDLLEDYRPKTKILETLGTSELAEANRKAAKRTAAIDEEFALKRTIRASPVVTELSPELITSLAHNWGMEVLEADDDERLRGYKQYEDGGIEEEEVIHDLLPDYREAYAIGDLAKIKSQVDILLKWNGIKLSPESGSYRALSRSLLAKLIESWEIQLKRFAGIPVVTPAKGQDLVSRIPSIVKAFERAVAEIARLVEVGEREAELERQRRDAEHERWRQEEAERRSAKALKDSRDELLHIIDDWAQSMKLKQFFEHAERKTTALGEGERQKMLERLKLARELAGSGEALDRFKGWKAPHER